MARKVKIGNKEVKTRNIFASILTLGQFKPKTFKDKKRYTRKQKHKKTEE